MTNVVMRYAGTSCYEHRRLFKVRYRMAKFSTLFGLSNSQASLDFVDVDLSTDTPLYIDPYAIQIRQDAWSDRCGDHIRSYFSELLGALRRDDTARANHLLSHLHEPNETFLGVSAGRPSGRGVGDHKASMLAEALVRSRAFQTGLLTDISEAELFIHGVGRDTISDLTTNVVRGLLAEYTEEQCSLHGIPTHSVGSIGPVWNTHTADWEARHLQLPVYDRRPILLVPKFSVRHRLSLDSQEFWNFHMIEYLRQEYLEAGSGLVRTFRSGERYVTKKAVKERHPFIKDDLADFVRAHPEVLNTYKAMKGAVGPLEPQDLENDFDECAFATALKHQIRNIPEGNSAASQYHSFALGVCTFLFYPNLIYPVKEQELHHGRKRVDIKFTNAAENGFFKSMLQANQTRALSVLIECKNYEKQINNPELDQLSGRFGHQRGFFGMLLCRRMDNRQRIIERCRDTAADGRGYMLVLEDADLVNMLELVEAGHRTGLDNFLQQRFDQISH